jgi:hypothetical protein
MPNGDVTLDKELFIKAAVQKKVDGVENRAIIEVVNLSKTLREYLLSQFTAWKRRARETNPEGQAGEAETPPIDVTIEAGYSSSSLVDTASSIGSLNMDQITAGQTVTYPSVIYRGQIYQMDPTTGPPDIGVRIECKTRMVDRTKFITSPAPFNPTFRELAQWANDQLQLPEPPVIETQFADVVSPNPARSIMFRSAIVPYLNAMYWPRAAAFVDDTRLIIKDLDKVINVGDMADVKEFIGTPMWDEWGVRFTTLFDPSVKLAQVAQLTSVMNPAVNGKYVLTALEYNLTTREGPFYVTGYGSQAA